MPDGQLNCAQILAFEELGSAARDAMVGEAVGSTDDPGTSNLITMLRALYSKWRPQDHAAQLELTRRFFNEKWDCFNTPLQAWAEGKKEIADQLPHSMPPGPVLSANMTYIMLRNLPKKFHEARDSILCDVPDDWRDIQARLLSL